MEREELWSARPMGYLVKLDRTNLNNEPEAAYRLHIVEEYDNYGEVIMYLNRKHLKDLRDALNAELNRKANDNG